MRIRKRVCAVTILSAIILAAILAMLAFRIRQENQSGVPDVVNSTRLNGCEHLTVVANRRDITDKEAFSHELIGMCRENTFHSVKLSFPLSALEISVYLQRGDIEKDKPFCRIEYIPEGQGKGYDIKSDPDIYCLYLDGIKIEACPEIHLLSSSV